jgi:hypothetical protein
MNSGKSLGGFHVLAAPCQARRERRARPSAVPLSGRRTCNRVHGHLRCGVSGEGAGISTLGSDGGEAITRRVPPLLAVDPSRAAGTVFACGVRQRPLNEFLLRNEMERRSFLAVVLGPTRRGGRLPAVCPQGETPTCTGGCECGCPDRLRGRVLDSDPTEPRMRSVLCFAIMCGCALASGAISAKSQRPPDVIVYGVGGMSSGRWLALAVIIQGLLVRSKPSSPHAPGLPRDQRPRSTAQVRTGPRWLQAPSRRQVVPCAV